jgi:hypothetical protein
MSDIASLKRAVVTRVLEGKGEASPGLRRSAFDNAGLDEPLRTLVDKVARTAFAVADEDFAAVRAAGLSEDQIYEIVVCAAIGQACRQYDPAMQLIEAVTAGK